jgi:hypothetical protein
MTKDLKNPSVEKDLAELKKLFAPPVLSSENLKAYYTIMTRVLECLKPRDFVELIFVKDLTDATWEIMRYSNHKTLVIEREHERHLEIQAKRRQEAQKRKADIAEAMRAKAAERAGETKQAEPGEQAGAGETKQAEPGKQAGAPTSQFERWLELEAVIDDSVPDVDEILDSPADELDHAKALESGIDYFQQLDRLMSVQVARRNDVIEQIEFYRRGLGQHLRQISNDIIDGEFSETQQAAPSIAGPGDGAP